jgi:hypothetical protein
MRYALLLSIWMLSSAAALAQPAGRGVSPGTRLQMRQQVQAGIEQMQQHMDRIRATEDPEERQRLMHDHMQDMHTNMMTMREMMGTSDAGAACAAGDVSCRLEELQIEQTMMQQMMHQMMEHMMQHMSEGTEGNASEAAEEHAH